MKGGQVGIDKAIFLDENVTNVTNVENVENVESVANVENVANVECGILPTKIKGSNERGIEWMKSNFGVWAFGCQFDRKNFSIDIQVIFCVKHFLVFFFLK